MTTRRRPDESALDFGQRIEKELDATLAMHAAAKRKPAAKAGSASLDELTSAVTELAKRVAALEAAGAGAAPAGARKTAAKVKPVSGSEYPSCIQVFQRGVKK